VHWAITSFFSTPLSQSSASMGSLACEKVVGRVRKNSAKRDWCGGAGGGALCWSCLLCPGPPVAAAPHPASPEPLGSQEPPALSRKVPLLVMPLVVRRAGTLEAAAHSEVPADRWVDGRCSCVWCGGYEPSII
jgi:hypothetical protein